MKMSTAKAFLFFLVALLLIVSLTTFTTVALRNTGKPDPELTVQLGSDWTTLYEGALATPADLAVTNSAFSFYDVEVRLLSGTGMAISEHIQTISSGYSGTFSVVPAGSYTIQARSADGIVREYTLKLSE